MSPLTAEAHVCAACESALNILRYYADVSYREHCYSHGCVLSVCHVQLFVTQWTVAHQAPLSMEFGVGCHFLF